VTDKKKGFEPPPSGTPRPAGSTPSSTTPPSGSRAAARRSSAPVKVSPEPSGFLEKYRFLLIIGLVVVGLGALGLVFMQSATAAPYTCTTLMTPGPVEPAPTPRPVVALQSIAPAGSPAASTAPAASVDPAASTAPASVAPVASVDPAASPTPAPSAAPQPTQRLGFVAQDMGQAHVSENTSITYAYCPPTSGDHFASNMAPLPRRFYGPDDDVRPGNWIHNLEHGYVVIAYKGEPVAATLAELERVVTEAKGTEFSTRSCGLPNKVIGLRFDDMTTDFAALSWDRALLLETFDAEQLRTFAEQWQESPVWPEPNVC